jgi:DNA polymerase-3 subunit alpha (Gram-positive type)
MDELCLRFLKKIGVTNLDYYQNCSLKVNANDKESGICYVTFTSRDCFQYVAAKELLDKLDSSPFKTSVTFVYENPITPDQAYALLRDELFYNTGLDQEKMPYCTKKKNELFFMFYGKIHYDTFAPVVQMWEELFDQLDIPYDIRTDISYANEEIMKERERLFDEGLRNSIKESYKNRMDVIYSQEENHQRVKGNYKKVNICEIDETMQNVTIDGEVFFVEERMSKKGRQIISLYVYDHTDSIIVMLFENRRNFAPDKISKYKEKGAHITIRGGVSFSKFSNEIQIVADYININPEPFNEERVDSSEEKRVELHAHSKMSTMDGVCTVDSYFKQASKWGHKALAITDHENVQAFPEVQEASKKYGVKALYGCEMNMIDDQLEYIYNPSEVELHNATYVVFDFETTGLSARYDRIIEFGAVKFKDGLVVDSMDFFVDPEIPISKFIQEKTKITNAMVRGQKGIKEALRLIQNFIGDSILVTHNASFDIGFLNEAFLNNGGSMITNPVIDTLSLSRYLFPDHKSHSLGSLCRQFEVNYDENVAHRADYDAGVLNDAWQAMLAMLTKDNLHIKHKDLQNLRNDKMMKNLRPSHVQVYAKNAQGLKDLFKLVSMSATTYFAGGTRIPRKLLEEYKENLIIGSSCFNGEVFQTALTRGENVLLEVMKFYDFIEVQPPANYVYLVNMGQIRSEEQIKTIISDVYKAANKIGKKVVATGDCHYLSKEDKIFRDVYVFAKAVGGGRHPLNPHRRDKVYFDNPDQHFRTTTEMLEAFSFLGEDIAKEIVITNSNLIASQTEELFPIKNGLYPPHIENCDKKLIDMCYETAYKLYGNPLPKIVDDRLKAELDGIVKYGYSVQYYIAHCIVKKSREDGFMVGSRGSVGSSLVAFMSNITEVNALQPHYRCPECKHSIWDVDLNTYRSGYDLPDKFCPCCGKKMVKDGQNIPFATFLGFKAEKVPDIDLNFSGDYQAIAHNMTKVLLGEKNVYRAGTIETVAEKTAFGYALGYYESLGIDPSKIKSAEKTRLAINCQDVKRTTGQHPGGIIVIPDDMEVFDFTPIQYPADDVNAAWKTTHFDFHKIHDNVLKLDLLGHVDPTALKMLGDITGVKPEDIPLDDKNMISLFSSDKALKRHSNYMNEINGALGLPEFGTNLSRQMLIATNPKTFADLLIISGLSHGTDVWKGNAEDLINNGTCTLQEVIGCRDDIMVWLSSQGIDNSTAFKIMEDVRKGKRLKPEYEDLLREHKIPEYYINACNKIKYLFPKAHAVAYVMMACRVAWYKVYYPLEYYATYFSTRVHQFDIQVMSKGEKAIIAKLEEYKKLRASGVKLSPKDEEIDKCLCVALEMCERGYDISMINLDKSVSRYWVVDKKNNCIIPPFNVLDGLGEAAAETVVEARNKRPFMSIEDLQSRTRLSQQHIETMKRLNVLKDLPESDQLSLFDW